MVRIPCEFNAFCTSLWAHLFHRLVALLVSACVDPVVQSLALYGTSGFASALSLSDLYCFILILSDSSELSVLCGSHMLQEHAQFSGVHSAHHVLPSSRERQQLATLAGPIVVVHSHV